MKTTFEERKAFLKDLKYVMEQAHGFAIFYSTRGPSFLVDYEHFLIVHNALLESSLSFLRKLNEFFGGDRSISITDYLPQAEKQWLFTKSDSDLLNNRVMHLSLEEARNGKQDWAEIYTRLLSAASVRYGEFLKNLQLVEPHYFK